jgi:hypothetical protein
MPDIPGSTNTGKVDVADFSTEPIVSTGTADFSTPKTMASDVADFGGPTLQQPSLDLSTIDWGTLKKTQDSVMSDPLMQKLYVDNPKAVNDAFVEQSLSKFLGMPVGPGQSHIFAQALWDNPPKDSVTLGQRIKNTITAAQLGSEDASLGSKMVAGTATPEDAKRHEEIKQAMPSPEEQLRTVPKFIVNFFWNTLVGLPNTIVKNAQGDIPQTSLDKTVQSVATNFASSITNLLMTPWAAPKALAQGPVGRVAVVTGIDGGAYNSLIDVGVDTKVARGVAIGLGAFNLALNALPILRGLTVGKKLATDVITQGISRAMMNGNLVKSVLGLGIEQGLYAYGSAAANATAPEIAYALSNAVQTKQIPLDSAQKILEEIGITGTLSMGANILVAGGAFAIGSFKIKPGGALDLQLREQVRAAGIHDTQVKATETQVAKSLPSAIWAMTNEQFQSSGLSEKWKPGVMTQEGKFITGTDHGDAYNRAEDMGLHVPEDKLGQVAGWKVGNEIILDKNFPEGDPNQIHLAIVRKALLEGKPVPENVLAEYPDLQRPSSLPAPLQKKIADIVKLSDAQVEALDAQTKSAESSADYIKNTDLTYKQGIQDGKDIVTSAYLLKKYINDISKVDEAGLPEEFAAPIRELKANFTPENFRGDTVAKLTKLRDELATMAIDNKDIPASTLSKIGELDKLSYSKMNLDDVKTIRDAIIQYRTLAWQENRIQVGIEQKARAQVVADSVAELPVVKESIIETIKNPDGTTTEIIREPGIKQVFKDKLRDLNNTATTKQIPFDDVVSRLGPTAKRVVAEGMHEGTVNEMKFIQDFNGELKQRTDSIPSQAKWFQEIQQFPINDTQTATLPKVYKLALYMHSKNPENTAHITGGPDSGITLPFGKYSKTKVYKVTPEALAAVVKSVEANPQEKLYVDTIADMLSKSGKAQAEVYARRNGIPLELVDAYYRIETAPLSRKLSRSEKEILSRESSTAFGVGPAQGHLKERTGSTIPLVLNPITHDVAISRDLAGAYIHLTDAASNAVKLLRDPSYARALAKINPDLQRNLIKGIRDITHNRDPVPDFELSSLKLRNNMGMAILAMPNEWPAVKQGIAIVRYSNYVDTGHLIAGITEAAIHPKQTRAFLAGLSPEFVDRIQGGQNREMADLLRQSKGQDIGGVISRKAKLMSPMRWGDAAVVQAGMMGAYRKVLDELNNNALSPIVFRILTEEFHVSDASLSVLTAVERQNLAIKYADYATEHTQAMSMPQFQSDMQRGSAGEKALTLFMSENMASLNVFRRFVQEAKTASAKDAPRKWSRVVKSGLIVFGVEAMANMFINRARREVTGAKQPPLGKDIAANLLNAPLQGAPLFGAITQAGINATLLGWDASNFSLTPMQAVADLGVKFSTQLGTFAMAPGGYQRQKAALSLADSLGQMAGIYFGVPYQPIMTNIKMGIHLTNSLTGGQ